MTILYTFCRFIYIRRERFGCNESLRGRVCCIREALPNSWLRRSTRCALSFAIRISISCVSFSFQVLFILFKVVRVQRLNVQCSDLCAQLRAAQARWAAFARTSSSCRVPSARTRSAGASAAAAPGTSSCSSATPAPSRRARPPLPLPLLLHPHPRQRQRHHRHHCTARAPSASAPRSRRAALSRHVRTFTLALTSTCLGSWLRPNVRQTLTFFRIL